MNVHKNAPLTPKGREPMVRSVVEGGLRKDDAAYQFNTPKTVAKWVKRFRAEGVEGLRDRSSRPLSSPSQTSVITCTAIEALRRQRHTGKQIAAEVEVSPATVSHVLRLGLNRMRDLEPVEPERRYEREKPGEIIHIDIKKLGRFQRVGHCITGDPSAPNKSRGAGWDYVHVCIDDHSRVAFSEIKPDETASSAVPFLKAAVAYYRSLGVIVSRVMTDNGSCYQSFAFRGACQDLGIKHIRTSLTRPEQMAGRTLHPDRISRMGVCQSLSHLRSARPRASDLAAPIQLAQTPRGHKLAKARQQTRSNRGQPPEAPHATLDRSLPRGGPPVTSEGKHRV